MKFCLHLPVFGMYLDPFSETRVNFKELRRMAEIGDEKGFDSLVASDHLVCIQGSIPPRTFGRDYYHRDILESWTVISSIATITEKMKLSNSVLGNPFRNPSLLAKMASTLDVISKGRFELGIGAGWHKDECISYGIPWPPHKERIERLRESVKIIKTLWTEKVANFEGKYYSVTDAYLEPKPVQKPHPPIWFGGPSEAIMNIVAEMGNGWDISLPPDEVSGKCEALRNKCSEFNRNSNEITISHMSSVLKADDHDSALKRIQPVAEFYGKEVDRLASVHLIGSDRDMVNTVEKFSEAGINKLIVCLPQDANQVKWFCENIITRFV